MRKVQHTFYLLAVVFVLLSCQGNPQPPAGKPSICVSIEPLRYFAEILAGEHFTVFSLVPEGANPETYDPTPQQLVRLNECQAMLMAGYLGYELAWKDRLSENAAKVNFYNLSEGIDLLEEEEHELIEPHIWNSTVNARIISRHIADILCTLDNEHQEEYRQNLLRLESQITLLEQRLRELLAAPGADRAFMIYHPSLTYFARDFGLHQISIETEGKEPTPAQLKTLMEQCLAENVHIVMVQPQFDQKNARIIAEQTNTRIVEVNPLAYEWEEQLMHIAEALRN